MLTVLIIEDEIKTARELKKSIEQSFEEVTVLDMLASIKSTVRWLKENSRPDIIFSDIQLADGLSFEIFRQVEVQTPIIFCTAYDEYAIEAFKTNGIDYLLKPIDDDKLKQSIQKYQNLKKALVPTDRLPNYTTIQTLVNSVSENQYKKTVLVHFQEKIIPLATEQIAYIHYELGNVYIVTFEKKRYFINQTLDEFETLLHPDQFFRANRQFIVNRTAIQSLENYFSRRMLLKLQLPVSQEIIISKTKSPLLIKWIEKF
ncbi:DNA-binding response regulator [Flavobacterium sediminis]|uniref:DNA-binding response regulator n=1 Tax=Flavobacterium sediminis TaxID=2201181 RepID=A0A2U8QW06_9FLAO|nr:LytTR family DNA-binding domain-containing protein [Flavobacterium sediminis]AWM14380.1 DNA-binding response regulator [Flavobacterium sediminis]